MRTDAPKRFVPIAFLLLLPLITSFQNARAQADQVTFPETDKTLAGGFLAYWQQNGGLAQFGFPISDEISEKSQTDGKVYVVQYLERAVFEYHPENQAPNDILLQLLGVARYSATYPTGAPAQIPNQQAGSIFVPETGHRIGSTFYQYWLSHGGLRQQGYPISDEFSEVSALNGQPYTVQYFERAVFEFHPENPDPNKVLLSQLGTFVYSSRYPAGGQPLATPTASPEAQRGPTTQAQVTRVIDGDTIEVSIDGALYRVRYIGIDTPETVAPDRPVGCYGPEASAANKALVEGKEVTLEKDVSEVDQYGRLLRYVYVGSTFVNAELVQQGYAHAYTYPPDVKYNAYLLSLQQEARSAHRGLWGAC
ncbi:MAG TPA: thermonuclease family protein [Chloroflexia bacterium]|nr:thermonuclease family protein [Chloroflexia bacterium]